MADNGTLSRPLYFDRQALRAEDLNALVDWIRDGRRRFNRHAVGWGVLSGLPVTLVPGQPWSVQVGPGFAIAPSGDEIAVPEGATPFDTCPEARACLKIPGPCPTPEDLTATDGHTAVPVPVDFSDPTHPEIAENPRDLGWVTIRTRIPGEEQQTRIVTPDAFTALLLGQNALINLTEPVDAITLELASDDTPATVTALDADGNVLDEQMTTTGPLEPQSLELTGPGIARVRVRSDGSVPFLLSIGASSPIEGEVYLALCPFDRMSCPRPAVPEACASPDAAARFARACEEYRLRILCTLPPHNAPPDCAEVDQLVCEDVHLPCPTVTDGCVVIATLQIGRTGILGIDEFRDRRRLLPQWLQALRHQCQCQVPPPSTPPPTTPTRFTEPSQFTFVTQPSSFTRITQFSQPSFFTRITQFSQPSFFTLITQSPSFFTDFGGISEIVNPGGPLGPGPIRTSFDPVRGNEMSVTALPTIGPSRRRRLEVIGVRNLTGFIEASSETLADTLGLSEVRVAELQSEARRLTREGDL